MISDKFKGLIILLTILSIVNTVITIFFLCRKFPTSYSNFDYLGVIVGILAFLITLLIGWNIYTVLDIKDISKEMNSIVKTEINGNREFKKEIQSDRLKYQKENKERNKDFINRMSNDINVTKKQIENDISMMALLLMSFGAFDNIDKRLPIIICNSIVAIANNYGFTKKIANSNLFNALKSIQKFDNAKRESILTESCEGITYDNVIAVIDNLKTYKEEDKDEVHELCDPLLSEMLLILSKKRKK